MKYGPFIFLGLLAALGASWLGMIATPQIQIGREQPTNVPPANLIYPTPFSGIASYGRDVYRANGCFYCHSQVVRQDGTRLEVVVTKPGTNETDVIKALLEARGDLQSESAGQLLKSAPTTVLVATNKMEADRVQKALSDAGADATVKVVPTGSDITRGWGVRLSVGEDYLYDRPVMLGTTRLGPDLANIGARQTNETWHLTHLYNPTLTSPGSTMPRYPYLFEHHPRRGQPRADALAVPGEQDVVPTREARALVAYLMSLKVDLPLFDAPGPAVPLPATTASTNQPAGAEAATNAPPAPAPGAQTNRPAQP